jgi:MinD superfamily P-loop ATPase
MKIAIASGKGGTGKTTVAVNLALSADDAQLLDADVEEPNANLFLHTKFSEERKVTVSVPEINKDRCTYCGECSKFCAYNALAVVPDNVLVFADLCHSCKGCELVCPVDAVGWRNREVGMLRRGDQDGVSVVEGDLNLGESQAIPVIKAVKREINADKTVIIDAPPGTSCPVMESIEDADYVILVTEPTPFGLHDLKLAVEVVRKMKLYFGVVINRDGIGDKRVELYCQQEDIPVLLKIPHDTRIASLYSDGKPFITHMPDLKQQFQELLDRIKQEVSS